MSHWSKTQTQFKDLAQLKAAAAELGCTWHNETTANVGFATAKDLAGVLKWSRESNPNSIPRYNQTVGVRKEKDGTYSLQIDWMFGGEAVFGTGFAKLKQLYGARIVEAKAKARGYMTKRVQVGGKLNLEITGLR